MQDQENRGKLQLELPDGVKQYTLPHGWLVVSSVGMCFVPYPVPIVAPEFPKMETPKASKISRFK